MENTILKTNESNLKMTNNAKALKEIRVANVNEAISFIIENYKESDFTNKKNFVAYFMKNNLNIAKDVAIDNYTKRAVKVAAKIIVGNYKIKKEVLSLAQMEQLICFDNSIVNKLMKSEDYIMEAKELIKLAKIEKTTKVFSKAKAAAI